MVPITFLVTLLCATVASTMAITKSSIGTRKLTTCDTFKACYLVNIHTRAEFLLSGEDTYKLDPSNVRGYSIRCDVNGTPGTNIRFIRFLYENTFKDENALPRYMNGDSNAGVKINRVPYLDTCGRKRLFIEGHVLTKLCFTKEFFINIVNSDGTCNPTTKAPTRAPVKPPTKAPTRAPVKPPTKAPTRAPVKPPTKAPTRAPVKPPTRAPTRAPVKPPTKAPTRAPVKPPTKAPTRAPVKPPTKAPTRAPVKPPTKAPVSTSSCVLHPDTYKFSVISFGDAVIAAHSMYKGIAIGGTLVDGSPNEHGTVDRTMSYVKTLDANARFNFNGGLTLGRGADAALIQNYEYIAQHAVSSTSGDFKVYVLTRGGTYNLYDFVPGGQGEDNGKTLVIFNTSDEVILTKTHDARQFGPSVIAPFSKVTILGDAGYVDGLIVGKTVVTSGSNQSQLQLHGDTYSGPLQCV